MPIYPEITINDKIYFETVDLYVFIESMTGEGNAREIIYGNFRNKLRWVQRGDCYSCGLADFDGFYEDGTPKLIEPIVQVEGKRIGERYSVVDASYLTRKDIPCTPDYDRGARRTAKELGIEPYPCGLSFEWLAWKD